MKRKLNWVSVGNLVGLLSGVYYMIHCFYIICIKPIIIKRIVCMTQFGFFVFILAIIVVAFNFSYFEERLSRWI